MEFSPYLKKRYPEAKLRELFADGEAVQAMLASPGWAVVMDMLDDEIRHVDGILDGGRPLEHVEYAHLHGQRRGLASARQAAGQLEARYVAILHEQQARHEDPGESGSER